MKVNRRDAMVLALAAAAPSLTVGRATAASNAGTLTWSRRKRKVRIHGRNMAYYEAGAGNPIIFLHGNPTSSYLWRNIIPHVERLGRCIAPDLIGMGDSDKLPDSGPDRYMFAEHQRYLFALFDALDLGDEVTFVVHDWGSALGFTWAEQNPARVRGIAHMEAIIEPAGSPNPAPAPGSAFARLRSPEGEKMILEENAFVESLISGLELYLTPEDAAEYRRPFLVPGEGRRPTLSWPRQLPLGGEPPEIFDMVRRYSDWLVAEESIPKLFIRANPGGLITRPEALAFVRQAKRQAEVTVFGAHFIQEVSPGAIGRALTRWIGTLDKPD